MAEARVVRTRSGLNTRPVFLVAFGGPLAGLAAAALLDAFKVPKNDTVIYVAVGAYCLVLVTTIVVVLGRSGAAHAKLRASGVRGSAHIVSARETGAWLNRQPVVELILDVEAQGMAPYRAQHREPISPLQAPRATPGSVVSVLVDPSDPRCLSIEWERP